MTELIEQTCPLVLCDGKQASGEEVAGAGADIVLAADDEQRFKEEMVTFTAKQPFASACEGDLQSKSEIFTKIFIKKFVLGRIKDGEAGYASVVSLACRIVDFYERDIYSDSMDDEVLGFWRCSA